MAVFDEASRKRLFQQLYEALDDETAGSIEAFAQNFLHNSELIDAIADQYPTASMSAVRAVMNEAYGAWKLGQPEE
ncbi:MAG: hypothetical protein HYU60_07930 [Magnetospirillum sp.]|nr:hypothetical protein [Magnetospirillum sp.]